MTGSLQQTETLTNRDVNVFRSSQVLNVSSMTSKPAFSRFILNNHQKRNNDKERLEAISKTEPEKSVACQRCRRLRKKCSKHFPTCLTCVKMGEDCTYVEKLPYKRRKRVDSNDDSSASATTSIVEPLTNDKLLPNNPLIYPIAGQNATNYTYQDRILDGSTRSSTSSVNINTGLSNQIKLPSISLASQDDFNSVLDNHNPNHNHTTGQNYNNNTTNNNLNLNLNINHQQINQQANQQYDKKSVNGPSSQTHITHEKPKIAIQNAILSTLINLGKQNFTNCAEPTERSLIISKEAALKYSRNYFANFYHMFPFIHKGQFYKNFDSLNLYNLLNPSASTNLEQHKKNFQTFLILNIGFKNLHNSNSLTQEEIQDHCQVFTNGKIQEFIFSSLTYNTTEDVKILTLLVIDSFFTKNCWSTTNLTNLLTGISMRLNLHRKLSKSRSDQFTVFEIEMRYRLFWSIYIIDRTVSLCLNKALSIPDEYINLPYPIFFNEFDVEPDQSSETSNGFNDFNFQLVVELNQLEGSIFKEVHSVLAINSKSAAENEETLKRFRNRVEAWYLKSTTSGKPSSKTGNFEPSNGMSAIWYTTNYYNMLTLLYRPSYLIPVLNDSLLDKLSKAAIQNLTYSFNSTINKNLFSINWISFFRVLLIFKVVLKCLISGTLNIYESRTELNLSIELMKNFVNHNDDWMFIYDLIEIFQEILKVSFLENLREQDLLELLTKAESQINDLLKANSVGCRLGDKIEDEYNIDERIGEEYNLRKSTFQ